MSKQFIIAQAGSSGSTAAPVQIIKVIKPPAGHTEVFHASFTGAVKVDFTAIANEKITLYHDNTDQTLHIIFTDGSQAIIEPFFDSMGVSSNITIEVAPNQDLNGAQFAAQFPITEDQTVLPAAGPGAPGTPASGADFQSVSVDPLAVPPPLPLLPPEELPPITFTNIQSAVLPTALATTITVSPGLPLSVDESFIPSIGSQQSPSGSNSATVDESGAFNVSGGGTTTYSLTINNATTNLIDSKTGAGVILVQNGSQEVDGYVTGHSGDANFLVFTLAVNSSGVVTMTDLRGVHEASADTGTDSNETISLSSGLVSLTATNGAVSADLDLGSLITIHDDGPKVTATTSGEPSLSVDESFIPSIGSQQAPSGSNVASGSFASLFSVTPGADGLNGSAAYSLTINNATTNLIDSKTGAGVILVQNGSQEVDGYVTGHSGDANFLVFTLAVNSSGVVTMTDLRGVHEASADTGTDSNETISLSSGLVSLTATVTDNDGDTASSSVDLGSAIVIHDDGPKVTATTSGEPSLSVDESFIPSIGSQQAPSGSNVASGSFASLFSVTPGADGLNGSAAYSLTINNATTNLIDSKTGAGVILVQNGSQEVDGYVTGHSGDANFLVFTLAVNSSGVVTMTDLRGVHEASADTGTDSNETISLSSGLVSLTATVTDNDGDTASSSVDLGSAIVIHDDGPKVTATTSGEPSLSVDESFIPSIGSQQAPSGSNVASGSFASLFSVTPGADGLNGSAAYSLTINNATTNLIDSKTGAGVILVQNGSQEVDGYVTGHSGDANFLVFTLAVNSSGVVTMTDLRGVHEASADTGTDSNETISLSSGLVSLTATVTDNDGDTASSSVDLGSAIVIHDDGPKVTATTSGEPSLSVDESFIPSIGSQQAPSGSNVASGSFASLFSVTPGADGLNGSAAYSLTINNATTNLIDSKTGAGVILVQNGSQEVDGYVTGHSGDANFLVFTLAVNSSGVVTMTDLRGVHEASADTGTDSNETISLSSGLVSLTATVTDNDGDTASSSVDLGSAIVIHDDGPKVTATTSGEPSLSVDESFIPSIGSQQAPSGSNVASGSFASLFSVTPGADGLNGSAAYSLTINNATTNLIDSKTGAGVILVQNGSQEVDGYVTGHSGDANFLVFTLAVNSSGVVTMTDLRGVHEASADTGTDSNETISLSSGLVSLTATVTDNDGDTASSSVDLGSAIVIHDDGPKVTATTSGEPSLSVDESFIPSIGSQQAPSGSNVASGSFASLFSVTPGADGLNGSAAYSLTINNATTNLIDSKTGAGVILVQNGSQEVDGYVTGHSGDANFLVFTLAVNSSGVVTMTDLRGVHEASADTGTDSNETISLSSGLVSLTATVTDNDGDTASSSVDLGSAIVIHDDGPKVTATTSGEPSLSVDESFIPSIGSQQAPSGSNVASGSFASLFSVTPGADGLNGSAAYSLTINNATTNLIDSKTGAGVILVQNGSQEVDGYVTGHSGDANFLVFTLAVNSSGVVTMTDLRGVHEASADTGTDSNETISLSSGLVSLTATVTDNDGDTASSSVDLGSAIVIHDDGPKVTATTSGEPSLSVDESFIPSIGSQQAPSGSNVASGSFASLFSVTPGADGLNGSAAYSLTINNATTNLIDSKTGAGVILVQNGSQEVDGYVTGHSGDANFLVFTLAVNSSGVVTMTDLRGVHEASADTGTDSNETISLSSGLVSLTATVTDNDGDTASSSVDLGSAIVIHDDGPKVTATTSGEPSLSVDESFIPSIGSQQAPSGSNVASGSFASLFSVTPGADGLNGSAAYSLTINNATTNLIDSKTGAGVILVQNGSQEVDGYVTGHSGDANFLVFTLAVNSSGVVTMTDLRGVHEASADTGTDSNETISLSSGLVSLTATVTDNDGDTASSSVDLGSAIVIHDDGPKVTATTSGEPSLSVDESFIPSIGSQQAPSGSNVASGSFASLFSVTPGADGLNGSAAYSLTINNATTNLIDSKTGAGVILVQNGSQEVDGYVTGHSGDANFLVFTLAVNSSGVVTMTDLRGVHEASADTGTDSNETISLSSGLVSLTATVTDNDGDTASSSVDLGSAIVIHDDGPLINSVQSIVMPEINGTDGHGTWTPVFGADGPASISAIGINIPSGTFGGLTYAVTDTGTHNPSGEEVFSVHVSGGSNAYTFYEYVHYDAPSQTAEMFAYTDQADAVAASGTNEFFTLSMTASGLEDFHLVSNSLQTFQTFLFQNATAGTGDFATIDGSTFAFQSGSDSITGHNMLIDGFTSGTLDPNDSHNTIHVDNGAGGGLGLKNGNLDTGETVFFQFNTHVADPAFIGDQSSVTIDIGKGNNSTNESFLITIWNDGHTVSHTETVTQADGTAVIIDATHWSGTTSADTFFNFGEVDILNLGGTNNDSKVLITGISSGETVSNTTLVFDPTITDGDGDTTSSATNLSVSLVSTTNLSNGYNLTGASDVLVASVNPDVLTGPGATVDYSNSTSGVTVNLSTNSATGGWATGDTLSGIVNAIGSSSNDTLTAASSGSTLVGGGGADSLTGGAGNDVFKYVAASDSTIAVHDTIAGFTHGSDIIDFSAISGITAVDTADSGGLAPASIAAHSIAYYNDGSGNTDVVVNTSGAAESPASAQMMMVLTGVNAGTLSSGDFHHA